VHVRRSWWLALILSLAIGAVPALAQEPTEEPIDDPAEEVVEPEDVTLYLSGAETVGELEINPTGPFRPMTADEPTGSAPKSAFVTNYVVGPNTACEGNALLPTWEGNVDGRVIGDVTLTFTTAAHPASQITVELFPDGDGGCDSSLGSTGYTPPVASKTVALSPGLAEHEVVFENIDASPGMNLVVMFSVATASPHQARLFYDAEGFESRLQFQCLPPEGMDTCLY